MFFSPLKQFALLLLFSKPSAVSLGYNLVAGFGGFEFIGFALPWIIGTTAAQHITLLIFRMLCKGKEFSK